MLEDRLARVIENLMRETAPRTIRLKVRIDQAAGRVSETKDLVIEQVYLQTREGLRYFDERMTSSIGFATRKTSYCDGSKCANIRYDRKDLSRQRTAAISREFMNDTQDGFWSAPDPLRFYYVGLIPLYEALPTGERLGEDKILGRTCDVFLFRDIGPSWMKQALVYHLDRQSTVPLKVTAYANPARIHDQAPNWIWEAITLDHVSGHQFPLASRDTTFVVKESGDGRLVAEPDIIQTIRVESIEFDTSIPRSAFWPTFQPGVIVMDTMARRSHRVPGGSDTSQAGTIAKDAPPISVPTSNGIPWLTWSIGTLGLTILVVAIYLRQRSKR